MGSWPTNGNRRAEDPQILMSIQETMVGLVRRGDLPARPVLQVVTAFIAEFDEPRTQVSGS
jgi:hypothetical protein